MLKPFDTAHELCYRCPYCGAIHWERLSVVQKIGKIVCYCDQVLGLEPVLRIDLVYGAQTRSEPAPKPKSEPKPKPEVDDGIQWDEAIDALVNLGCKKLEARRIVEKAIQDNVFNGDMDDFIRYLVSEAL